MTILEKEASTLGDLLNAVQGIRETWNPSGSKPEEIWFRGQSLRRYELVPGLYRPSVASYDYEEHALVSTFLSLSHPFLQSRPTDDWERYYLAQHYRLPTRLLDWTESLLVALYFAIKRFFATLDKRAVDATLREPRKEALYDLDSPAVWVIDAGTINEWSTGKEGPYAPPHDDIGAYLWNDLHNHEVEAVRYPVAIVPPRQNPRIIAQQGTFTLHGHDRRSLEELAQVDDPDDKIRLACISLDQANLAFLWDELRIAGVTRVSIYQDLDSVAEHVKWVYQN